MTEATNHSRHRVVISAGLWRGFDVAVEPPVATRPLQHFRSYGEAQAHAEEISRAEGWPWISLVESANG